MYYSKEGSKYKICDSLLPELFIAFYLSLQTSMFLEKIKAGCSHARRIQTENLLKNVALDVLKNFAMLSASKYLKDADFAQTQQMSIE